MSEFAGFPIAGPDFYEDLEADNSKMFWTANKHIYEDAVKRPMTALISDLEPDFGPVKIFRPYRDVRFSKDKSPYKTHQGAVAHTAPGVGWYVQIGAPGLFVAGGLYAASPEQLSRLRATLDDDVRGAEFEKILDKLVQEGYVLGGSKLKTRPKGYPLDHPRIDLLRHKSLVVSREFGTPGWLKTPRAATEVRTSWETLRPIVGWLGAVVGN
ncbi:DUF2461 domain-containing protein [Nocardia zapadnayensis]|uniref:DUF2461 domain-containing protein n=1 Tax=Nocardia rhamnosiphila TaxID=426716 RepID=UPI00224505C2|nr:DUF2461 domain-containing protein [Nocardia zapadnayensis]MCX0271657.1 DUF2461 domain-containing protein [Nocardia zapadnayensis]